MRVTLVAVTVSVLFSVLPVSAQAVMHHYQLNIPRQPLDTALKDFAQQTGLQVARFSDRVDGSALVGPVSGELSAEEALQSLLAPGGLTYKVVNEKTVAIMKPGAGAKATTHALDSADQTPAQEGTGGKSWWERFRLAQADQGISGKPAAIATENGGQALPNEPVRLEEVIVTAQKRVERLQDVPVALTVLNPDTLAANGQNRLEDYFSTVPGLTLLGNASTGGTEYLTIRGLGTSLAQNPTVSAVVDDVPVGSSLGFNFGVMMVPDLDPSDLERIEVLKGPQGTLYGADSLGGLLKYVTRDPSTAGFSGRAEVAAVDVPSGGVGYAVRGAANVPVSDTFAFRVSGFSRRDPGYIDNLTTGQTNVNSANVYGGHVSAFWHPSSDFSVKVSALIQQVDGNGTTEVDANNLGQFTLGDLNQTGVRGTGEYRTQWQLYSATLKGTVGGVDITSVTGYSSNTLLSYLDFSGGPSPLVHSLFGVSGETETDHFGTDNFSQEIRLSAAVGQWMDWLVGGFYTHQSSPNAHQDLYATDITTGSPAGELVDFIYHPATLSERAVFGDLNFHITDRFDLQVGGRESWNSEYFHQMYVGPVVPVFYGVPSPDVPPDGRASGKAFTYLVTPKLTILPNLTAYARVASGYRLGGANFASSSVGFAAGIPSDYKPDSTVNYELGIKGELLEHRLSFDAAAYYIDWKDIQLLVLSPTRFGYTTNAGGAKSEGVELSMTAQPVQGFTITAEGSYNNAVLTQNIPSNAIGAYGVSGDRLPYSARVSAGLTANQDFHLSNDWIGFVGGSVNYLGSRMSNFAPSATVARLEFPAYTTFNLRTGAKYDSWLMNLYLNNVGNRLGILGIRASSALGTPGDYASIIQPRTLGLSVSKTF